MIWFLMYILAIAIFYCLFISSGEDHNTALLTACLWPVVLIIMTGALIAGMIISVIVAIKNKIGDKK